jgi:chromosome segregation ATPase
MNDLDDRLKRAIAERDELSSKAQRIEGRKQAALESLEQVKQEIRSKNLDPENLDQAIETLSTAYQQAVAQFEQAVTKARDNLSPYLESAR